MYNPPYGVFAWDYFKYLAPERWYKNAEAFADCATLIYEQMLDGKFDSNWPRAKAGGFMYAHAIELFLKAAIAQAGKDLPRGHDLDQLFKTYRNLYPAKTFEFTSGIPEFLEENRELPFFDFLKYPEEIATVGTKWDASIHIDVKQWFLALKAFAEDIRRLWPLIVEKHPHDAKKWAGK